MPDLLRVKGGFVVGRQVFPDGQLVPADHPVGAGREALFVPAEDGIEQATRAPGERRVGVRREAVVASAATPKRRRRGGQAAQ